MRELRETFEVLSRTINPKWKYFGFNLFQFQPEPIYNEGWRQLKLTRRTNIDTYMDLFLFHLFIFSFLISGSIFSRERSLEPTIHATSDTRISLIYGHLNNKKIQTCFPLFIWHLLDPKILFVGVSKVPVSSSHVH